MLIRYFIPLAVAVIALLCVGVTKVGLPAPPFGMIATVASLLLLLQLEDHKLGNFLSDVIQAFKREPHA